MRALVLRSTLWTVLAVCLAGAMPGESAAPTVVQLGTTGLTAASWPIMVALKKSMFAARGIDLETVAAQNAPDNVRALLSGGVQLVSSAPDSMILPDQQGADLAIVAGISSPLVFRIVGAKGVTSLRDVTGKSVAVSRTNGPDAAIFRDLLARAGITEYRFVNAGGSDSRLAAVAAGGAAATMLVPPDDLRAIKTGFTDLGFNVGRSRPLQFTVLFASRSWAKANAATVVNTLRGLRDGIHWLNDRAHRTEAAEILAEYTHIDPDLAAQTYDIYVTRFHVFAGDGRVDPGGLQNVLDYLAAAALLTRPTPPLAKYVEPEYLNQAR